MNSKAPAQGCISDRTPLNVKKMVWHNFSTKASQTFFFFFPAPFWTAEVSGLDCFTGQSPGRWTKRVGHFYPGGPGIAREMAKSKPELLNEGLVGGWARGVGLGPRPGFGSRVARSLQHW